MPYKVFFVEDEIVTREGIRDNVDWKANGFEFAGEATDGETALPLMQTIRPDVLITDIKMPFMDGLQLSKIIRERMPWVKIIILSGHDEFEYAQQAIELGVTEYLLKPVTLQNLHRTLQKVAAQLDRERKDQENLKKLQEQLEVNQAALKEKFLLKLVVGAVSPTEAIEQGQLLGLDLIARCYLVIILKANLKDRPEQFDYDEYQHLQQILTGLISNNPDIFWLKKDWEELVLVMKGNSPECLEEERDLLLEQIKQEFKKTSYQFTVGAGTPKKRIADISRSFVEALVNIQDKENGEKGRLNQVMDRAELLKVDKSAVENYLRCGVKEDFDKFFDTYIRPVSETALKSYLLKNYIFVDVVLATAKLIDELGGEIEKVVPELSSIELTLANIQTIEQLREQAYKILSAALVFRDGQRNSQHTGIIQQAKEFIERHYMDPDLSLTDVACRVNLSPSHFSLIFSQEAHQTFKDHLTEIRIKKAKELLRTTALKAADIAYQVGYNDPHYFSYAFKKNTGLSPIEFRQQTAL
ncbi:MAG: DNA-binding response regulator [Chloroflexi bacterium HGW-Chloroflexi-6]|nr:MAG: DNA-binding response regulator [Chloroflexi bacterium HGW-Chloroflexi-6]